MDEFLVNMIAHVEQQYSDIERECSMLRKLFKPWPKRNAVNKEKMPDVPKEADQSKKEVNNGLTPNEKLALEEMDRLLSKAQKAIKIKEKEATTSVKSNGSDSSIQDQDDSVNHLKDVPEKRDDVFKKSGRPVAIGNKGKLVTQKKEVPYVRKHSQNRVSSGSGTTEMRSNQQVSSRLSSSRSVTPHSSSVSSNTSRPSSSRSRYTPAHVNAPFKTDINTRVPNRKHNHVYKNHLNKTSNYKNMTAVSQKQPSHLNGLKTLPKIAQTLQENQTDIVDSDVDDKEPRTLSDTDSSQGIQHSAAFDYTPCLDEGKGDVEGEDTIKDESKISSYQHNTMSEKLGPPCIKQDELFSLRDKNSKIKIPQRLQKLVTENCSLLEKCSTAKLVKRMPNTDGAHSFVQRLNETYEVSQELWAKVKALTCVQSHNLMLKSLNSLGLEEISEATPFQTVYRAKKLLEFILTKFAQTQDEADYLSRVQFRPCQSSGTTSDSDGKDAMNYLFKNQGTTETKIKTDQFVMDALMSSKIWTRLQFEKDLYQLQLRLLCLSEAEWWPILCKNSEHGSTVQMIHSLLTSSGEFFPAIVENPYS